MKVKELNEKVQLLKAGQRVEIAGHIFTAKRLPLSYGNSPCMECNVDCICHDDITDVCNELDFHSKYQWYLNLEA